MSSWWRSMFGGISSVRVVIFTSPDLKRAKKLVKFFAQRSSTSRPRFGRGHRRIAIVTG